MALRPIFLATALLGVAAMPGIASAITVYTHEGFTNLRAGPGTHYAAIAKIPGGSPVEVIECLPGPSWCDTTIGDLRGWVAASRLQLAGWWYTSWTSPYGRPLVRAGAPAPPPLLYSAPPPRLIYSPAPAPAYIVTK